MTQHDSLLSPEEIGRIREFGDALEQTSVKLYGESDKSQVDARGSHFPLNAKTQWLYEKMEAAAQRLNQSDYHYDLIGFCENFYYLRYSAGEHFNWHVDMGAETPAPRKLSLVLQLSDPAEYDGGDFDVMLATDFARANKALGSIIAFPSYKIHRVTPVTRGERRTLTMFASGPNFR